MNNSVSTDLLTRHRSYSRGATRGVSPTNISSTNKHINGRGSCKYERVVKSEKSERPNRSSLRLSVPKTEICTSTYKGYKTAIDNNTNPRHGIERKDENTRSVHGNRQPHNNIDRHAIQRNSFSRNRRDFGGPENRNLATNNANNGHRQIDVIFQSNIRDDREARELANNQPIRNDRPDVILTSDAFTRGSNDIQIVHATKPENRIPYTPCEICKADVAVNRVLIPCLHKMCYSCCLNTEKYNNNRCPFCRQNIEDLNYVCCNPIDS